MENNIFEVIDKSGRRIRLTRRQFDHILRHKGMEQHLEDIKETLERPLKVIKREEGNILGIELLDVSKRIPMDSLSEISFKNLISP